MSTEEGRLLLGISCVNYVQPDFFFVLERLFMIFYNLQGFPDFIYILSFFCFPYERLKVYFYKLVLNIFFLFNKGPIQSGVEAVDCDSWSEFAHNADLKWVCLEKAYFIAKLQVVFLEEKHLQALKNASVPLNQCFFLLL